MSQFSWLPGGKDRVADAAAQVVMRVADEVLADAVANCPVDTGTLANSFTRTDPDQHRGYVEVEVGTPVTYGPFVEFGTRHSPVPPGRVRHGGRRPFLGPAVDRARRRYG